MTYSVTNSKLGVPVDPLVVLLVFGDGTAVLAVAVEHLRKEHVSVSTAVTQLLHDRIDALIEDLTQLIKTSNFSGLLKCILGKQQTY